MKNKPGRQKGSIPWNKGVNMWLGKRHPRGMLGKKVSISTKLKMSEKHKGHRNYLPDGFTPWNKGKKGLQISWNKGKILPRGKNNPKWKGGYEYKLLLNRQRRVQKLGNGGLHTLGDWETLKAQYNWTCLCCKRQEPEITLTQDHIIPLTKGGSDNIENIQPLCKSCNSRKHDKIIKY